MVAKIPLILLLCWPVSFCSCNLRLNLDYLRDVVWEYLALVRVYTKKRGGEGLVSLNALFCSVFVSLFVHLALNVLVLHYFLFSVFFEGRT